MIRPVSNALPQPSRGPGGAAQAPGEPADLVQLGARPSSGPAPTPEAVRSALAGSLGAGMLPAVLEGFEKDLAGGATPEAASARLRRLDEALHVRIRPFDWQTGPVFETWRDLFAGTPEAEAGVGLLVALAERRVLGEEAAGLARAVVGTTSTLGLQERTGLLGRVLDALGPDAVEEGGQAAWSLLRARLEAGQAPAEAAARATAEVGDLRRAMDSAGLGGPGQRRVLEACSEHLAELPALLPAWPVRLLDAGVDQAAVLQAVAGAAATLGPLLERAGPEAAADLERALEAPLRRPWRTELRLLEETLRMQVGSDGPAGVIAQEGDEVLIGGIRLPRRLG